MPRRSPSLRAAAALATILAGLPAAAETTVVDLAALPGVEVYGTATLTPLALSAAGSPAAVLLDLAAGEVVPPHATESGLRLLTVLSGDLFWGDGEAVDPAAETRHAPGAMLAIPAGADHWLAARNGPLRLMLVVLDDETPVPALQEQMQ